MYTLLEVKKMVMDMIGEDSASPTYWTAATDSQLVDWINWAIEELCVRNGMVTAEMQIPLWATKDIYFLSARKGGEFLWVKNIRCLPEGHDLAQTDVYKESRHDYNWITRTGTPYKFIQLGNDAIRPVPIPGSSGQVLEATVVIIPRSLSLDEDGVRTPDYLIQGVVDYAAGMYLVSVRRLEEAAAKLKSAFQVIGISDKLASNLAPKKPVLMGISYENLG